MSANVIGPDVGSDVSLVAEEGQTVTEVDSESVGALARLDAEEATAKVVQHYRLDKGRRLVKRV